jgi:hypothetical protein
MHWESTSIAASPNSNQNRTIAFYSSKVLEGGYNAALWRIFHSGTLNKISTASALRLPTSKAIVVTVARFGPEALTVKKGYRFSRPNWDVINQTLPGRE